MNVFSRRAALTFHSLQWSWRPDRAEPEAEVELRPEVAAPVTMALEFMEDAEVDGATVVAAIPVASNVL